MSDNPRPLSYELKHPIKIGGTDAAGTIRNIVPAFPDDSSRRIYVTLELSLDEYIQLASTVDVGRDIAYGDMSDNIWWLWIRSLYATSTTPPSPPVPAIVKVQYAPVDAESEESEGDEDMPALSIEVIDGVPYLEQDCGCGERRYYTLSQASVNPQTGAISNIVDSPPSFVSEVPLTDEQISTCYSAKVADIIVNALEAFTFAVFDYAVYGAAALFPVATTAILGAVEIQQTINAALNGNVTLDFSNVGYTASEVVDVFKSVEFKQFIEDRIGDDQKIARWVLELVAIRLSNRSDLNFPTPVSPVFNAWLLACNISSLNQQLETAATECATGNSVPDTSGFEIIEDGGVEYLLYSLTDLPLQAVGSTYLSQAFTSGILAVIVSIPHSINSGGADYVNAEIFFPDVATDTYSIAKQDGNQGVLLTFSVGTNTTFRDLLLANSPLSTYGSWTLHDVSAITPYSCEVKINVKTIGQVISNAAMYVLTLKP